MIKASSQPRRGIVRRALTTPVLVSVILLVAFCFQTTRVAPWLFGTQERSLKSRVEQIVDQWAQGIELNGFALSPGERIAFIPASEAGEIEVDDSSYEVVGLSPILPDSTPDQVDYNAVVSLSWGILEVSTRKHDLLGLIADPSQFGEPLASSYVLQYVYLGKRYLGYATRAARASISGETVEGWFAGEYPMPLWYRTPMILNLVLLAFSLPYAISAFVMDIRRDRMAEPAAPRDR